MAWEGRAFSSGAGGVAGQALEWGENLAFQRASSCRQGSGLSISLVHGLMKVEFLTPLVQTGQDRVLSPVPATFQPAAALAASTAQETGFDESQPHQG